MFPRRPTENHPHKFSTAERPVCVPYKRKSIRLNRRAAAPAASATLNVKTVTIRAFDKYALHGLKKIYTNPIRLIPKKLVASRRVASAFTSEQQRRGVTFFGEEERRSEYSGEERSRKRYAVRDDERRPRP